MDFRRLKTGLIVASAVVPAALLSLPGSALAATPVACFTQSPTTGIVPAQTITFDSTCSSDADNDISGRGWDLDNDGSFDDGTGTTATKSFATAGSYTVRLGVIDRQNHSNVATKTVVVTRPPVASFTISPAAPTTGQAVTFTSTSTDPDGTVASQAWDIDNDGAFDDGTAASATKTFATAGNYTVRLQATDDNGATNVVSKTVTVSNRAPVAGFTISPAAPTSGQAVTFTSTSTDPDGTVASQAWDIDNDGAFDDGTAVSASKTFMTAGTYTVRLQVTDNNGATNVVSKTVTVANRPPAANFTISPAAPATGQAVTFTSTSTDPDGTVASQAWDTDNDGAFDDGTGASASKTFATPGTYTVRLQATDNNGATNVVSKTVTVGNRPPVASFTVSPSTVYEGDPVTLTSTATDPDGTLATQEWDLDNDGAYDDATGPSATFNPPAIGAFSVGLRVVDDRGAASTVTQNVTVEARPSEAVPTPQEPQQQSFDLSAPIVTSPSEGEPTASAVTPLRWLSPFPTVRMRGRTTRRGAQLSLLTVRGPHGAIAEVRCKGRGCPLKVVRTKLKTKAKRGSATVHFKRFERFLPGGVELQISVSEKGMVGKYTRIKIRKLALPVRTDRCLLPDSIKPTACPVTP